jgi:hypothetical protein
MERTIIIKHIDFFIFSSSYHQLLIFMVVIDDDECIQMWTAIPCRHFVIDSGKTKIMHAIDIIEKYAHSMSGSLARHFYLFFTEDPAVCQILLSIINNDDKIINSFV